MTKAKQGISRIAERLIGIGGRMVDGAKIADLRLGLGYTLVELDDGRAGLAWTAQDAPAASCTKLRKAGKLLGLGAEELLGWLDSGAALERGIGLAVFNALNHRIPRQLLEIDAISLLKLGPADRVVMVGYFAPLMAQIKETGCQLQVAELSHPLPGLLHGDQSTAALAECDVAIITGTSLITDTIDALLASLRRNRAAVLLGPSTPLCPEAFAGTRVSQLSGAYLRAVDPAKAVVSQGGGTMVLRPHLRFATAAVTDRQAGM